MMRELTDALADYPEDVILVMYGDHLPTMGLTVEDLKNKYLFQTQYVMWDNFGLKKKRTRTWQHIRWRQRLWTVQESMRVLFFVIIRQEETQEIIRWIWKPFSMMCFTENNILMMVRIRFRGPRCVWDFMT